MRHGAHGPGRALCVFVALGIFGTPVVCQASTVVAGVSDPSSTLVIDPTTVSPTGEQTGSSSIVTQTVDVIQNLPISRKMTRVLIGYLSTASSCTQPAVAQLYVSDTGPNGYPVAQSAPSEIPTTPSVVAFVFPKESTLVAGDGYSFSIEYYGGCSDIRQTTWDHNQAQVNPGADRCTRFPYTYDSAYSAVRMWHVQGQDDLACDMNPSTFDPSMPTGWLYVLDGAQLFVAQAAVPHGSSGAPACQDGAGNILPSGDAHGVFWRYDSSNNNDWYVCIWNRWPALGSTLPDGWYYALPWDPGSAPRDMYLALSYQVLDVAQTLRPFLRFDTSEEFRPLKVDSFFGEPGHQICAPLVPVPDTTTTGLPVTPGAVVAPQCSPLTTSEDLGLHHTADSYIDIAGDGNAWSYRTPDASCTGTIQDCDYGPRTGSYYHVVTADGGYTYFDYWYFYRFNDYSQDFGGQHEGDWEGVTVAIDPFAGDQIAYVSFSQHGTWFDYVPQNLDFENGHVVSFVTNGGHANYPSACSDLIGGQIGCFRNSLPYIEKGHDGADEWGGNLDPAALTEFPQANGWSTGHGSWVDWPGRWGSPAAGQVPLSVYSDGPPRGPGQQSHFSYPGPDTCPAGGCPTSRSLDGRRTNSPKQLSNGVLPTAPGACRSWFASDVPALLCDPGTLTTALKHRAFARRALHPMGITTSVRALRTASARGIAQAVGGALVPGQRMRFTIPKRTRHKPVLMLRTHMGRRLYAWLFDRLSPSKTAFRLLVRRDGSPLLKSPAGTIVRPSVRQMLVNSPGR